MVGQAAGQDQRGKGLLMNREVEILANLEEIKDFIPYLTYRTILGKILEGKDLEDTARGIRKLRKKMMKEKQHDTATDKCMECKDTQ